MSSQTDSARVIDGTGVNQLLGVLGRQGYRVVGSTVREGAIRYDTIAGLEDLLRGWTDEQAPGRYRLNRWPTKRRSS